MDMVCDMIMTEILVRLPPESIFMYCSVSKRWNRLLTSPEFLSHYAACFHHKQRSSGSPRRLFVSLDNKWCWLLPTPPPIDPTDDIPCHQSNPINCYITSSNGLVLFSTSCRSSNDTYHVLNPVTRKQVSLPPLVKYSSSCISIGLSCDEDDDLTPRYEVVAAAAGDKDDLRINELGIQTYSSDTKEWRESVLVGTSDFTLEALCPPHVVNGVFYWEVDGGASSDDPCLAVYDPHNKQRTNWEVHIFFEATSFSS